MATHRLSKPAVKKVHAAVDKMFDNLKTRSLGYKAMGGKKLYVAYRRDLSLPGLFEAAMSEEGGKPNTGLLDSLLAVSGNYIDSTKERAKAKVVQAVNAALGEFSATKPSKAEMRAAIEAELTKVWDEMTGHVQRIVETEGNTAKNVGLFDAILQMNERAGVEDPTMYFVVVRDDSLCAECKRLHLQEDGVTPRLWKLSEVGHSYHKRGEEKPKLNGLHPHCRCVPVTLLPGFGFDAKGGLTFKRPGHDELGMQRAGV